MLTRVQRRYSGSLHSGVRSTASIPSAAAERKMAPTLVGFITRSSTTTRLALAHTCSTAGSSLRFMAHSIPRVRWKPVICASTGSSAVNTGTAPHCASSAFPWLSTWRRSMRNETGSYPAAMALPMTLGLSAIKMPRSSHSQLVSRLSLSLAKISSSGAEKSVISRISAIPVSSVKN